MQLNASVDAGAQGFTCKIHCTALVSGKVCLMIRGLLLFLFKCELERFTLQQIKGRRLHSSQCKSHLHLLCVLFCSLRWLDRTSSCEIGFQVALVSLL